MGQLRMFGARGWLVCALAVAVIAPGCGTLRSHRDRAAAAGGAGQTAAGAPDGSVPPGQAPAGSVGAAVGNGTVATPGSRARAAGTGRASSSLPAPGAQGSVITATASPIRIGAVGTLSGIGGTQRGTVVAVQAWARWKNDHGGLNGHPVEVIVVDDGGDAARFRAALQELVEQDHVIAFVGALTAFTLTQGAVQYLEQRRVPMIGGDRGGNLWNQSPMMFPQASAGHAAIWIHVLDTAKLGGPGAPVGLLTCQEAQQCQDANTLIPQYARQLHLDLLYQGQASITQPDFTAECLRAHQAGVKYFILGMDVNSDGRIAAACSRQGFQFRYETPQTAAEMADEPDLDGTYFASATFPWVSNATPAMAEFQQVIRTYTPTLALSAHASSGWVAAKLFEKAAANLGPNPTSAQVLGGLWSISNDTLGGLTAPLTFVRDQPAPPRYCFFPMGIDARRWVAYSSEATCEAPGA